MKLFQLLLMLDSQLQPKQCKVHFAQHNGEDDPLDVYLAGEFDEWQSWQTKQNFGRHFVVSLIALPRRNHWLFVGAYDSVKCEEEDGQYHYEMRRRPGPDELDGRLIVSFEKPFRWPYPNGETVSQKVEVVEIRADRMGVEPFPGYSRAMLSKQQLDLVVQQQVESWKSALAAVAGVYVIADRKTGKLYVGSATGEQGIWGRWSDYEKTGHGGNVDLVELLQNEGDDYAKHFQFGVLEIANINVSQDEVRRRESYWKDLLLTRAHGYNSN